MGKSKIDKMREKGVKTCPASRHAHMIVDGLRSKSGYGKLLRDAGYDPNHMAESIESVVMSLWDARQYLEWEAPASNQGASLQWPVGSNRGRRQYFCDQHRRAVAGGGVQAVE